MIFAIPLYDDNPTARDPIVTYLLIGLCVGAFLWQLGQNDEYRVLCGYGMIPARLFGLWHPPRACQVVPAWTTLVTSMFLHGGWFHLIGNMMFLWIFGNNIEDVLGHGRFVLFYLCCGVVAALCQAFSSYGAHVPMVGASGAIAGVLGAYLILYPSANVHVFIWIVIFFRIVIIPAWILLGLWFALQLFSGFERAPGTPGVAFWAHVGGFVAGVILVTVIRPRGLALLQPARSRGFAAVPPSAFAGRRTFHGGSVPPVGRPYRRRPGLWG
jgi:membrane associated rhomboid family serine protease